MCLATQGVLVIFTYRGLVSRASFEASSGRKDDALDLGSELALQSTKRTFIRRGHVDSTRGLESHGFDWRFFKHLPNCNREAIPRSVGSCSLDMNRSVKTFL